VDFARPLEALIPGARGRVLASLVAEPGERALRQLAGDAGVSPSRCGAIVEDLAELGLVERRVLAHAVVVRLSPSNTTAGALRQLASVRAPTLDALRAAAGAVVPVPSSLTVFGAFAGGGIGRHDRIDVVAVGPPGSETSGPDAAAWSAALRRWVEAAEAVTGNPVHLVRLEPADIRPPPRSLGRLLAAAAAHGILLAGEPLDTLVTRVRTRPRSRQAAPGADGRAGS
jgi:hypothetical protein